MKKDAPNQRIAVGYISRTKGVRGYVKVDVFSPSVDRFKQLSLVVVQKMGAADLPLTLADWRSEASGIRVKFTGIDTPEEARQRLVGGYITIAAEERAQLPEDVYYIADLEGCTVENQADGQVLGTVKEVLNMPTTDVYLVRGPKGELLVPAVGDFIVRINIGEKRIWVQGVEDLWQ